MIMASGIASASIISDDFEREVTTTQTSNPNAISTVDLTWHIDSGAWNISSAASAGRVPNQLLASADGFIYAQELESQRSGVYSYTLSADVWCGGYESDSARRQGLVFNYQDDQNYYAADYLVNSAGSGTFRLLEYVDGARNVLGQANGVNIDRVLYYAIDVTGDASGIEASISTTGGTLLQSLSDSSTTYLDGYAGFWRNSSTGAGFDNFSLEVIPEPTTLSLLGVVGLGLVGFRRFVK